MSAAKVSPRAVRLFQRPVDVVAKLCRAEQRLLARLPIVGQFAFGRFEHADIDQARRVERRQRLFNFALLDNVATLRDECFVSDA